jgi:ribosomal protein S18 acetylase RimI-like enzyme
MGPVVRPALPLEADALATLVRAAYTPWIPRLGREPSPIQDDYAQRISDGQVWLLEEDGELLGVVILKDGPDALLLPNIAVAPAAQGQGHGRRLIAFAEAEARRRGYDELRLFVNTLLVENIALYQHLGFVEVTRIQGQERDRTYLCMAKAVAA